MNGGEEFDVQAAAIAEQLPGLDIDARIAAACRGSGNPAALAWLAENLRISEASRVIDLGAGLGGPAAWLQRRYRCEVFAMEPAFGAVAAAGSIFGLIAICGSADGAPFPTDAFTDALLLGVLSVVDDRRAVLSEAQRIAASVGVLDYCSTSDRSVRTGGSEFPSVDQLVGDVRASGWNVAEHANLTVPAPQTWTDAAEAIDVAEEPSERAVIDAIDEGRIAPVMVVGRK